MTSDLKAQCCFFVFFLLWLQWLPDVRSGKLVARDRHCLICYFDQNHVWILVISVAQSCFTKTSDAVVKLEKQSTITGVVSNETCQLSAEQLNIPWHYSSRNSENITNCKDFKKSDSLIRFASTLLITNKNSYISNIELTKRCIYFPFP